MRELRRISPGKRGQRDAVRQIARDQDGVVTRAQLLAVGVGRSAIDRALQSGRLHHVHAGVYVVASAPRTPHTTAPFPTTSVPRTPLDLAARYDHRALLRALAEAEFRHDLRPADIERTLRRGHPGSAKLRAALDAHAPGYGSVKSNLERRCRALLIRRGIALPLRNEPLGPWTVDCLWPQHRVVAELDGRQHARPSQADRDDDRDLWLRSNRYVARRYGERQIAQRPEAVIADLLAAFDEAAALGYAGAGVPLRL